MKRYVKKVIAHPMFSGSLWVVLGTNANNVIQYLYHPVMGRLLGVERYGEMVASFSLIVLIGILPSTLSLVVVKYISSADSEVSISKFFSWIYSLSLKIGGVIALLLLLLSPAIAAYLKLPVLAVAISASSTLFVLPVSVIRATLQGRVDFKSLIISIICESVAKLVLGVILVLLGLSLTGALLGVVIASLIGWLVSWLPVRKYYTPSAIVPGLKPIVVYAIPVVVSSLATTSLFSSDVILAKHFLTASQAGIYASLSALGKVIIYASGPISSIMFPAISMRHAKKAPYLQIFLLGFAVTAALCSVVLFIYKIFPYLAVGTLFGSRFVAAVPYLFLFGLAVSLFSLSSYLTNFLLSINCSRAVSYPAISAVLQIVGINFFHASLYQVIYVSLGVAFVLLTALLLETIVHYKNTVSWAK